MSFCKCHSAKCPSTECYNARRHFIILLNVIVLLVAPLKAILLNVIILYVALLKAILLNAILPKILLLVVILLNVILLVVIVS